MIKVAQVPLSGPATLRNWTIDSLDQAYRRGKMLAEGRAVICERPVKYDL